jgi:hypothetical protein
MFSVVVVSKENNIPRKSLDKEMENFCNENTEEGNCEEDIRRWKDYIYRSGAELILEK